MRRLALLVLAAALSARAADPRVGTWTLSSAQSAVSPPTRISITPLRDHIHVVISGDTPADFTVDGSGRETPVKGVPGFNQIEWRRMNKNQVEIKEKKDGLLVATLRDRLSLDRKELTITTSAPGRQDQTTVWLRSEAPIAANPFAGEWTQDLTRTRLRQGLVLKIEPDGNAGVRFSGEFNYTAGFDGKEHMLRNSRNDTVTLILVDAHTVDSIYKRGDFISERDRWVVSDEGRQLTVTTTGTLESGQKLTEKLVFRRK